MQIHTVLDVYERCKIDTSESAHALMLTPLSRNLFTQIKAQFVSQLDEQSLQDCKLTMANAATAQII